MSKTMPNIIKTRVIYTGAIIIILMSLFLCWAAFKPHALESVRTLTVSITSTDGTTSSYMFETTEPTLYAALKDHVAIDVTYSEVYGYLIYGVNGIYVDPSKYIAWTWTVNGMSTGMNMDECPVADGDVISFYTYTW